MTDSTISMQGLACPLPLSHDQRIILGHGSGGKMTHNLIQSVFLNSFQKRSVEIGNDGAVIDMGSSSDQVVISTDSHVVTPLFFPGGDIGRLAVCGTVNDVSMMGAAPQYITAGFILEEGFELSLLRRIVQSMQTAAEEAGVQIVAGDTKVVQRGKADGVYINTTGVGALPKGRKINGSQAKPGDVIILSGTIGDHGIAVLAARGELGFQADIQSDVAPLNHLVQSMLSASQEVHVLRDPTRGGLATTLNEIADQSGVSITIEEEAIVIAPPVRATCEMLGLDPLYVANEGKLVAFVPCSEAEKVLEAMHNHGYGRQATVIGSVTEYSSGQVLLRTPIGTHRIVTMLSGELLPRIC